MLKKLFSYIVITFVLFSNIAIAKESSLPFIGQRSVQFTTGNCTEYQILISQSGQLRIETGGCGSRDHKMTKLYSGPFKRIVKIRNYNGETDDKFLNLRLSDKFADIVDENGEVVSSDACVKPSVIQEGFCRTEITD